MQDGAAWVMAPRADQCEARHEFFGLTLPEGNAGPITHDPFAVRFMQIDWHATERITPFHHGRVVVRMRDRDRLDPTHGVDHFDRGAIDECDAIPQDVSAWRAHKHRALADAEVRKCKKRN